MFLAERPSCEVGCCEVRRTAQTLPPAKISWVLLTGDHGQLYISAKIGMLNGKSIVCPNSNSGSSIATDGLP